MSNPFNTEERPADTKVDQPEIKPGFLEADELTFEDLIKLARARATKEVTKKLLDDVERLWAKLMSELGDKAVLEKHFLKLIELKLNTAKNNEGKP